MISTASAASGFAGRRAALPMSLRLGIRLFACALLGGVVGAVLITDVITFALRAHLDDLASAHTAATAELLLHPDVHRAPAGLADALRRHVELDADVVAAVLRDGQGSLLARAGEDVTQDASTRTLQAGIVASIERIARFRHTDVAQDVELELVFDRTRHAERLRLICWMVFGVTLVIGLAGSLFVLACVRQLTAPLGDLVRVVQRFGDGEVVSLPGPERIPDREMRALHQEFARMIARREALERESRQLRAALDRLRDGLVLLDAGTLRFRFVNGVARRSMGIEDAELLRMTAKQFFGGTSLARAFDRALAQLEAEGGEQVRYEDVYEAPGELRMPVEVSIQKLATEPPLLCLIARDVSERHARDEALRTSQRRLLEAQAIARCGSWEWNIRSNALTWTDETFKIFGLEPGSVEPTYSGFIERVHPDERAVVKNAVERALAGTAAYRVEHRIQSVAGAPERWVLERGEVLRDAEGRPLRMLGVVQDVTERHNRAAEECRMRRLLEESQAAARLGSWEGDLRTGTCTWSEEQFRLLGLEPGTVKPCPDAFASAVVAEDRAVVLCPQHLQQERWVYEARVPDGDSLRHLEVRGNLERDGDGRPVRVFGTTLDITARKRAELEAARLREQLEARVEERTRDLRHANARLEETVANLTAAQQEIVRAQKLAALGSLVTGVAHELNTPLGVAVTVATTLSDRAAEFRAHVGPEARQLVALEELLDTFDAGVPLLLRNLERASQLIADLKQVSADRSGDQRRVFDLARTVTEQMELIRPLFARSGVTVQVDIPPGLEMDGYPGKLGQVLFNLVTNAQTHAFGPSERGTVRIAVTPGEEQTICLSVSDDGRGIAPEHLGRIFDPFFTTRMGQGSTGLGLYIVHELVQDVMGGTISVTSRGGQGTEFHLCLPARMADPPVALH